MLAEVLRASLGGLLVLRGARRGARRRRASASPERRRDSVSLGLLELVVLDQLAAARLRALEEGDDEALDPVALDLEHVERRPS